MATDTIPASWRRPTQPGIRRRSAWALASAPLRSGTTLILVVASSLLVVSAVLHLHLWASGYRAIPTIGPLFLAQGIATPIIAVVLVLTRWLVSVAAAAATMIATIGGFVLADTVGLFGFHDGFAAPFASISFGFEVTAVGLLLIGGALVVRSSLNAKTLGSQNRELQRTIVRCPSLEATGDERFTVARASHRMWPPRR